MHAYVDPRGIPALLSNLGGLKRYAVTGSLAVPDSVAPARLGMIYVDDVADAADFLKLVPTTFGANVWLLEPYDTVVFERIQKMVIGKNSVFCVAISQVIADLLTSPGRGSLEAEAMIDSLKGAARQLPRPKGRGS